MAIKVTLQTFRSVRISGIRARSGITQRLLNRLIREILQDDMAEQFLAEKTAKGNLKKNTPAYERWKEKQKLPFGNKRGHLTGATQRALDKNKLWRVNWRAPSSTKDGLATVIFMEDLLIKRADHYKFYKKQKTPGTLGVLILTKKRAQQLQVALRALEKRGAGGKNQKKAIDKIIKKSNRRRRA